MDPLIPTVPELPPTPGAARGGAAPADAHQRWRLELERAQLRLRPDTKPAQPAPASAAGPGDPARPGAAASRPAAPDPNARRAPPDSAGPASKEAFLKAAPQASAAGAPARADVQPGRPAFGGASLQPRELPAPPQAPQQAPGGRAPQRTVWPSTSAFALVSDDQVKAWVRDASLGEAERKRLLQELRARLRAAGLKLDTLTVNGREESSQGE